MMMNSGANSDSIPMDLIREILSRLPAKSIDRFRCVSKLWKSIICRQDFIRSPSKPRLLIGVEQGGEWSFFSSPQPHNHYGKSSLVVAADFHTTIFEGIGPYYDCSYDSGLIYMRIFKENDNEVRVICNPSTGQCAILPPDLRTKYKDGFLGFDPIGKQFKVLIFNKRVDNELVYQIMTLGTENLRWREIICPLTYRPCWENDDICINGVLYYIAFDLDFKDAVIGCFDVRSEKFKFLYPHDIYSFRKLINYKGKLGAISWVYAGDGGFPHELNMWVLEDVEKREWTTYSYTLRAENKVAYKVNKNLSVVGVTASGEIVLAKKKTCRPFYVFYFNPERNTLLSVEIQGVGEEEEWFNDHIVYYFVDHVEDHRFDVMKTTYAAASISPPRHSTSTSSREDASISPPGQRTSTSSREDHQVRRTVAHLEQDRRTFESVNKFDALRLLEDD